MSSPFWRVTRTLLLSLRILAFAAMCAALSGCLEIGSDDDEEEEIDIVETPTSVIAPSGLSYQSPVIAVVGTTINELPPTVTGTTMVFGVSPALPPGLTLNAITGVISGTPTAEAAQTTYTITASNTGGSTSFELVLTVNPAAPSSLSYSSPIIATVGEAISLTPVVTGTASSYAVEPALPAGLTLDEATGVISGTPSEVTALTTYEITASNVTGSTSFDLTLTVAPEKLTGLFRDATVIGLGYSSADLEGVTNENGEFIYRSGETVTFAVGNVTLGTTEGKPLLTPMDLVEGGTGTSTTVLNIVRFLMMLDEDGDPTNGLSISEAVRAAAEDWPSIDFGAADFDTAVQPIVAAAQAADGGSHVLQASNAASQHFRSTYFCLNSGLYVGTSTEIGPVERTRPAGLLAQPTANDVSFYDYADGFTNFLGIGGTPGYYSELTGWYETSMPWFPSGVAKLTAQWLDDQSVTGTWDFPLAATPDPDDVVWGAFNVKRALPATTTTHRFTGFTIYLTRAVLMEFHVSPQADGSAAPVSGALYTVATGELIDIEGTLEGTALTATAGDIAISATYEIVGSQPRFTGTIHIDDADRSLQAIGCRVN